MLQEDTSNIIYSNGSSISTGKIIVEEIRNKKDYQSTKKKNNPSNIVADTNRISLKTLNKIIFTIRKNNGKMGNKREFIEERKHSMSF